MNDSSRNRPAANKLAAVKESERSARPQIPSSAAFLVTQVGAHAASRFAERLKELDLVPPQAGVLRNIAVHPGTSQQALAGRLGMAPSRLVALLDELQGRGLVERRPHADDRRLYALHLSEAGTETLAAIGRVARAHDEEVLRALDAGEREVLAGLLARVAEDRGLVPGVHPAFARMQERAPPQAPAPPKKGKPAARR
jgi:DNA-binding MarR family transcriptional regulator